MKRSPIFLVIVVSMIFASACSVPTIYMVRRTAEATICDESEIAITSPNPPQGRGTFDWQASCRDTAVRCHHEVVDHQVNLRCESDDPSILAHPATNPPASAPVEEQPAEQPSSPEVIQASTEPTATASSAPPGSTAQTEPPAPPSPPVATPPSQPVLLQTSQYDGGTPPPGALLGNSIEASQEGPVTREEVMRALATAQDRFRACTPQDMPAPPTVRMTILVGSDGSLTLRSTDPAAPPAVSECLERVLSSVTVRATTAEPFELTTDPMPTR